ncbi:pseudouridine synthase [Hypoxylon crocopeplum]|nr:pseudouridine synthase [Hypoxylon crocopeplum]
MATHTAMAQGSDASMRSSFEQRVGIIHYASQAELPWHGQIRTRFTDFQVHEISKDGEVVRLHDFQTNARELAKAEASRQPAARPQVALSSLPKEKKPATNDVALTTVKTQEPHHSTDSKQSGESESSATVSQSDRSILTDLLGQGTAEEMIDLYSKAGEVKKMQPKNTSAVKIAAISDKAQRSRVHSEVRRIFGGKLDTLTDADGSIKATIAGKGNRQWGTRSRNDGPRNKEQNAGQGNDGKFLHFTLYKENRDTIEAINHIARTLNLKPSFFGTAGTKDRRAVTAQRVSMRRRNPQTLVFLNNERVFGVKIGDFKFENYPIQLGQHSGNEFVIVVKNCYFNKIEHLPFVHKLAAAKAVIHSAVEWVNQSGFINYYGTQRFGTHDIGTQEIGMKILKDDFEGAVQALLSFNPDLLDTSDPSSFASRQREDSARARACSTFLDTGDAQEALKYLPRRCHVESTLMRHLSKQPKDFLGALLSISRGMRSMYGHAYQSLVWNFAASKRWELFGDRVVKGDLIIVESEIPTSPGDVHTGNDDEETIHLADSGSIIEDSRGLKAHALTEEEATSGKYSIFDIVLPTPGWDVVYPDNEIGQFYGDFMGKDENGGLNPQDMLRRQRDFSLRGSYRKLMGKFIRTPSASVQAYVNDTDQLVPTDLDLIRSRKVKEAAERAAARRDMEAPPSAWQGFVDNVQDIDRQESRARVERRKAEESSKAPEGRAIDTWIQTSVDGSNKRIKVSERIDDIKAESENTPPETRGDEMQVDDVNPQDKHDNVAEDMVDQPNGGKGTQSTSQDNADSASSIVATLTSQTPENAAMPEVQSDEQALTAAADDRKDGTEQSTSDKATRTPSDPESRNIVDNSEATVNKPKPTDTVTSGHSTIQTHQPLSPTTTDEKKIAVILRFALDTSQYATVVLRELQKWDPKSNDTAAVASSSISPHEDAVDSS